MTLSEPAIRLSLNSGDQIVLVDMLGNGGPPDQINRNVTRVASTGETVWTIETDAGAGERQPYTNIRFDDDGRLRAYSWSGVEYEVDLATGGISRGILVR